MRVNTGGAVFVQLENIVGRDALAHFHAGAANRHAGNGEAYGTCGFFSKEFFDQTGGNMAFKNKSVGAYAGMTGLMLRRYTQLFFNPVQIFRMVNDGAKAIVINVGDPIFAAAAGGAFVDIQHYSVGG